jgi:transposase
MPRQETQANPTRRQYTAEFRRELVERCQQPGASVSAIALENRINANVLFRWRREHLRAISGVAPRHGATQAVLLPVKIAAAMAPTEAASMSSRSLVPEGVIEIDLGAARVRLRGSVDGASLRCVLHALKAIA